MARSIRVQYPGAVYHVTCRGNEQRDIFRDDEDRRAFLEILAGSRSIYSVKLYAGVLMGNHFHLLLETPLGNLNEFMRRFNITYTGYFNRRHRRVGHLYQGRYKSILVEKESYLSELSRYIHINPVRTQEMEPQDVKEKMRYLLDYKWSTLPGYLKGKNRWAGVDYGLVLSEFGGDTLSGRRSYGQRVWEDLAGGVELKGKIIGGSVLGREGFVQWVKEKFLKDLPAGEYTGYKALKRYKSQDQVLDLLGAETGFNLVQIIKSKGDMRRLAMELLYRGGGLTGGAIGSLFGVSYSAVSQERRRLVSRMAEDETLKKIFEGLYAKLSG